MNRESELREPVAPNSNPEGSNKSLYSNLIPVCEITVACIPDAC